MHPWSIVALCRPHPERGPLNTPWISECQGAGIVMGVLSAGLTTWRIVGPFDIIWEIMESHRGATGVRAMVDLIKTKVDTF